MDNSKILELFKGRCPKCKRLAVTVHELEPRARGSKSFELMNQTAIDRECHEEYHRRGASADQVLEWKGYIKRYLKSIGMWEVYVQNNAATK